MAFDFSKIVEKESEKIAAAEAQQKNGGTGFKTVYPFNTGRLEFQLLANEPSNLIYRELVFHEYWADNKKQKTPCAKHMYGETCKICDAVSKVQEQLMDTNVFGTHGFKKQGIMFAKLLNFTPDNYFGDNRNPPKIGDTVKFMFPKSVISELGKVIVEYGDEIQDIVASNSARRVVLTIGSQANGFNEYSIMIKGTKSTCCVDGNNEPDDTQFASFMATMPNLNELIFGACMKDTDYKVHTLIAEEIDRKYFGQINTPSGTSISESITSTNPVQQSISNEPSSIKPSISTSVTTNESVSQVTNVSTNQISDERGDRPDCFNNNLYDAKCNACVWTNECV